MTLCLSVRLLIFKERHPNLWNWFEMLHCLKLSSPSPNPQSPVPTGPKSLPLSSDQV